MRKYIFWIAAILPVLFSCRQSPAPSTVRLIDVFEKAKVEGSPRGAALPPAASWNFGNPPEHSKDPLLGWKAGHGIEGLKVADGKLTGRTTTDFPILYVSRPARLDTSDTADLIEVRIRVNNGTTITANGGEAKLDFAQTVRRGGAFPWPFRSALRKSDDFQTLSLTSQMVGRMKWETLMLRPADAAGATFEIESVRLVSQRERRASIPSGVGWQGLSDIYKETIVSRSPEKFTIDLDIPANAWLDVNLGTVEDHPVTFKIAAVSSQGEQLLMERTLTTPHRWEPAPLDLSAQGGRRTLRFWVEAPEERSVGFWGTPAVRVRGTRPESSVRAGAALGGVEPAQGVILIMCDTLRKDHLTIYGHKRDTSPNLAKIASQGAVFLDNISQGTWTKVATPSLMTSLHPTSHQILDFTDRLPADADTLAEVYRNAGYATVAYSSVLFTGKFSNLHQGFEELHESASVDDPKYTAKTARAYVGRATNWIERHRDTPFFMFLHVFDPHDPFEPREPYASLWADPQKKEEHEKQLAQIRKVIDDPLLRMFGMPSRAEMEKAGVDPAEFVAYDKDWYDGSIRGMDVEIGRLLQRVRQMGLEGKVQIAFTSDHGEEFIEHGRMFHGQTVYGELAGVPLFLYRPGVIPEGVQIKETVRSIDVMPTLLDLSGLPVPKRVQGQSLVPLLAAARDAKRTGSNGSLEKSAQALGWKPEPAVIEKKATKGTGAPPPRETESYGIVSGEWKLVHNVQRDPGAAEFELYDHRKDPLDTTDVAARHPEIVDRLKTELAAWKKVAEQGKLPKAGSSDAISSKDLERLRSMGYVQ